MKKILRLAVPSLLANLTIPLVGIVDIAIAGHISDASAIAGIAVATTLFDLLYWNFGFLRISTGGVTAQAYGAGDVRKQMQTLIDSSAIALGGALLIWLIQYPFVEIALRFIDCSAETALFARQYFFIRIWAAPATLLLMTFKGWFIGLQNTVVPMISDIVVNITNIVASYLLAVRTPVGAIGVAWGTLIAQYAGLTITGVLVFRHFATGQAGRPRFDATLFRLNSQLIVRSLCFMVIYVGFTKLSADYGTVQTALGAIIMKIFMLYSYLIDGFAYAGEALTGRYIGENNRAEMKRSVNQIFVASGIVAALATLLMWKYGTGMVGLLTSDNGIREASNVMVIFLVLMPLVSTPAFIWDGIFIGATRGKDLMVSMILSVVGFVGVYCGLYEMCGIEALYWAYLAHLIVRSIYLTVIYFRRYR